MGQGNIPLARYTDRRGRAHLVLLRERLVLDVGGDGPRVVAELSADEGIDQARAALDDGGYLERAAASEAPFCRALSVEDLRPAAEPDEPAGEDERRMAA